MKIFILNKNTRDNGTGTDVPKVALLQDWTGLPAPYSTKEYLVFTEPAQVQYAEAALEVEGLSQDARDELGLTFNKMAALWKQAEPDVALAAGDKVYLSYYRSPDGCGEPFLNGIYATPQDIPNETPRPFEVFDTFPDYLAAEKKKAVQKEISALSGQTKKILGLKVLGGGL
jgi:hypothetical protein